MACKLIPVVDSVLIVYRGCCSGFLDVEYLNLGAHLDVIEVIII